MALAKGVRGVRGGVPILLALEDEVVHPVVAAAKHFDELVFHFVPVVIAPEEEDSMAEARVESEASIWFRAWRRRGGKVRRAGRRCRAVAEAGEQGLLEARSRQKNRWWRCGAGGLSRRFQPRSWDGGGLPGEGFNREGGEMGRGISLRAKARISFEAFSARLKSCPDTSCGSGRIFLGSMEAVL